MMEKLFGNPVIEKVLLYLMVNQKGYPTQLKKVFDLPLYSIQRAMARLEQGGIIIAFPEGKTLVYQLNPRYPFLKELKALLKRVYAALPADIKKRYYERIERKRPRRRGKPLTKVRDES